MVLKPKVDTEVLNYTTRYEADETKEKGVKSTKIEGVNGSKVTTTTYTVNPTMVMCLKLLVNQLLLIQLKK